MNNTKKRKTKKRKRKPNIGRIFIIIAVVLLLIVGILGISYAVGKYFAGEYLLTSVEDIKIDSETAVAIEIPQGATTRDIAEILKKNNIISSEFSFRLKSKLNGGDGNYTYGIYMLSPNLTNDEIIALLQQKPNYTSDYKLTIPEGYTLVRIASLVDEMGFVTKEDFISEANNGTFEYDFLEGIPKREYYLEGYLFPDTYYLTGEETAHDIIVMLLNRFQTIYNRSVKSGLENSNYTLDEILIIASMIEGEAMIDSERAIVAGVIYNRLGIDMPLQIDATIQYALGDRKAVVTYDDLKIDSPYNTYLNNGLPVGPICNPGEASLIAAINPENHNYYYYVLKEYGSFEHVFTETYDQFLVAKEAYNNSRQ